MALAAGTVTFVVMKKNKRTSVDSKAEQLIARWFDAMTEKMWTAASAAALRRHFLTAMLKAKA